MLGGHHRGPEARPVSVANSSRPHPPALVRARTSLAAGLACDRATASASAARRGAASAGMPRAQHAAEASQHAHAGDRAAERTAGSSTRRSAGAAIRKSGNDSM